MKSIDNSLRRLGTDYVDLYQIHRFDYETPIEETLEALNDCVRAGKVRYIGGSAMFAWQFLKMVMTSDARHLARFASMQCYYNLLYRENEREVLPMCRAEGIAVIPYSPLARGFVAGNRKREGGGETLRSRTDPFSDKDYYQRAGFRYRRPHHGSRAEARCEERAGGDGVDFAEAGDHGADSGGDEVGIYRRCDRGDEY